MEKPKWQHLKSRSVPGHVKSYSLGFANSLLSAGSVRWRQSKSLDSPSEKQWHSIDVILILTIPTITPSYRSRESKLIPWQQIPMLLISCSMHKPTKVMLCHSLSVKHLKRTHFKVDVSGTFLQRAPSGPHKVPRHKAEQDTSQHMMTVPSKLFRMDLIICPLESILVMRKKS